MDDQRDDHRALQARIAELERQLAPNHRDRRRGPRVSPLLAAVGLALGMLIPGVVMASHQFPDVLNSHPFHSQITKIADAGITAGFPDGGYHPADPVTRQAMAAFMERGFGHAALAAGAAPMTTVFPVDPASYETAYVPVRELKVTVPGASNAFNPVQLVHVQGRVAFASSMGDFLGCPCEFEARIRDTSTNETSPVQYGTFYGPVSNAEFRWSFDVEGLFTAPPGQQNYLLEVKLSDRYNPNQSGAYSVGSSSSLTVATFPFNAESPPA